MSSNAQIKPDSAPAPAEETTAPAQAPSKATQKKRISRDDWLKLGFRTLAIKGHSAISVEPIARALGVSKGSFYHHFADLPTYKAALLDTWKTKAMEEVVRATKASNIGSEAKLRGTVEASIKVTNHQKGPTVEPAIRNWARHDADAYQRQIEVDVRRLVYMQDLFEDLGFSRTECESRATLLYGALIGLETLTAEGAIPDASALRLLVDTLCKTS